MLEKKKLDSVTPEDLVDLRGVLNSLREGAGNADDFFDMTGSGSSGTAVAAITAQSAAAPKEPVKTKVAAGEPTKVADAPKPAADPAPTADTKQERKRAAPPVDAATPSLPNSIRADQRPERLDQCRRCPLWEAYSAASRSLPIS